MNNKLMKLDSYSTEELQIIQEQIVSMRMQKYEAKLEELGSMVKRQSQELSIIREENEAIREVELKRHRVTEHRYGFVSANDLGQCYQVSIGSITIGKLLRLVGLAKEKQSKTEPLRSATINGFSKSEMYGDFPTYRWNPEKCMKKIDRWLEKEGIIDEFYAIEDEAKLTKYISDLAKKYGEV